MFRPIADNCRGDAPHPIPCRASGRRALPICVIRAIRGIRGQRSTSGTHVLLWRERGDDSLEARLAAPDLVSGLTYSDCLEFFL